MTTLFKKIINKISGKKIEAIDIVIKELLKRKVDFKQLNGLELFGGVAEFQTAKYGNRMKTFEIWEIDKNCESTLRKLFPNATIKITDSFKEIKTTASKFNFIMSDNPMSIYGPERNYCEHFEMFDDFFRVMDDEAILILDVIPSTGGDYYEKKYPYLLNDGQVKRRNIFYGIDDSKNIPLEKMQAIYSQKCLQHGFETEWFFHTKRSCVYYFVFKLKKMK